MTLLAATLVAFAVADLSRGDARPWSLRTIAAAGASLILACALARLAGMPWCTVALIAGAETVVLLGWVVLDARATGPPSAIAALLWLLGATSTAFAASGAVAPVGGPLKEWFASLAIHQPASLSAPDQFVVAVAVALFLLASANRLVRLVLVVAQTPTQKAETTLRGGRLIGPMERLFIGAMLVAGEPTGVAIVIAAKGLLRLPEIQRSESSETVDEITEYFLIGTFSSMLVAIAAAGTVLAIG